MFNCNIKKTSMRRPISNDIKYTKCFYEFYPRYFEARVLPMWLNSSLNNDSGKICIRHRWEGEMGSSQHKSPHQDQAFRKQDAMLERVSRMTPCYREYLHDRSKEGDCRPTYHQPRGEVNTEYVAEPPGPTIPVPGWETGDVNKTTYTRWGRGCKIPQRLREYML